jgi:hypothetical protein
VRAYGIAFLGRPRSPVAERAHDVDRRSLAAMAVLATLCLLAGILPGFLIDALAPVATVLVGQGMPPQHGMAWLSIVPIAESRSSYNGLLIFAFVAGSAALTALAIRRLASSVVRRAPPWDCGFPDPSPLTQHSAGSFAQPIRRVFGAYLFGARERTEMPPPGDLRPARFAVALRDSAWDVIYTPLVAGVSFVAERMNHLQFLTIRRYLSLVFLALVVLLLALVLWS